MPDGGTDASWWHITKTRNYFQLKLWLRSDNIDCGEFCVTFISVRFEVSRYLLAVLRRTDLLLGPLVCVTIKSNSHKKVKSIFFFFSLIIFKIFSFFPIPLEHVRQRLWVIYSSQRSVTRNFIKGRFMPNKQKIRKKKMVKITVKII